MCLHRTLIQFMLDTHMLERGYAEAYVPYTVNTASIRSTGQLSKFEEGLLRVPRKMGYSIEGGDGERVESFHLISTAKVSLTNLVRNGTVAVDMLSMMFAAYSPYFRSEAGLYGKNARGMIHQHQSDKVGMV